MGVNTAWNRGIPCARRLPFRTEWQVKFTISAFAQTLYFYAWEFCTFRLGNYTLICFYVNCNVCARFCYNSAAKILHAIVEARSASLNQSRAFIFSFQCLPILEFELPFVCEHDRFVGEHDKCVFAFDQDTTSSGDVKMRSEDFINFKKYIFNSMQ